MHAIRICAHTCAPRESMDRPRVALQNAERCCKPSVRAQHRQLQVRDVFCVDNTGARSPASSAQCAALGAAAPSALRACTGPSTEPSRAHAPRTTAVALAVVRAWTLADRTRARGPPSLPTVGWPEGRVACACSARLRVWGAAGSALRVWWCGPCGRTMLCAAGQPCPSFAYVARPWGACSATCDNGYQVSAPPSTLTHCPSYSHARVPIHLLPACRTRAAALGMT